jgi:hypothetical protein
LRHDDTLADVLRQINGPLRAAIEKPAVWHAEPSDLTGRRSRSTAPVGEHTAEQPIIFAVAG